MSTYTHDGQSFNDGIELMISILVRYPEINTIKTDPKAGKIIFSFLMKKEMTEVELDTFQKEWLKNIEAFLFLENKEPEIAIMELQSYQGYSMVEVVRDFRTISQREISLLIHLVRSELEGYLLTEVNTDQEVEDLIAREEIIEDLLDRIREDGHDDLIGYREAGKVMVFQKAVHG